MLGNVLHLNNGVSQKQLVGVVLDMSEQAKEDARRLQAAQHAHQEEKQRAEASEVQVRMRTNTRTLQACQYDVGHTQTHTHTSSSPFSLFYKLSFLFVLACV